METNTSLSDIFQTLKDLKLAQPAAAAFPRAGKLVANSDFFAAFLNITPETVRRIAIKHGVRAIPVGKQHFYDSEDFWEKLDGEAG